MQRAVWKQSWWMVRLNQSIKFVDRVTKIIDFAILSKKQQKTLIIVKYVNNINSLSFNCVLGGVLHYWSRNRSGRTSGRASHVELCNASLTLQCLPIWPVLLSNWADRTLQGSWAEAFQSLSVKPGTAQHKKLFSIQICTSIKLQYYHNNIKINDYM